MTGAREHPGGGVAVPILLTCIIILGAVLRFNHISGPVGGYHAMNEAQYISIAHNFNHVSLLRPTGFNNEQDSKVRALYVYTVYAAFRLFGESPAAARAVSALAGTAALLFIFFIGRFYGGARAGLLAAGLLSVLPIHVMLSRNAQPDAMCSSLCLLSVLLYLRARDGGSGMWRMACAGLVWGAAVFTKNFALLLLPCVLADIAVNSRGGAFRKAAAFVLPATAVVLPFLVYQLATNASGTVSLYRDIVLHSPGRGTLSYISREAFWALGPGVSAAAAAGLVVLISRGATRYLLPISCAVVFCVQYFFQNVHSYYFLSAAPFLVLAGAIATARAGKTFSVIAGAVLFASSLTLSALDAASLKIDFGNFHDAAARISEESKTGTLISSSQVISNNGPVLYYYLPGYTHVEKQKAPLGVPNAEGLQVLDIRSARPFYLLDFAAPGDEPVRPFQSLVMHRLRGVRVLGCVFTFVPYSWHSFIPQKFKTTCDGGIGFGYEEVAELKSLMVSRVPDSAYIFMKKENGKPVYVIK